MLVVCRTQQLLNTVTILKNFHNFTRTQSFGALNHGVISTTVSNRGPKVRLGDRMRSWSSSELSPQEVNNILRANEYTHEFLTGIVKSYDSNQLAANNPIEDTRSEASCLITSGLLVGVFDGHGGKACAQVVAKRLHHYIAACLLPNDTLKEYIASLSLSTPQELIHSYNDKIQFADNVSDLYKNSFIEFLNDLADVGNKQGFEMRKALEKAFLRLDEDLSKEALLNSAKTNEATFSVAESGACACVAHIDGVHLHMAHVGDCCAVLGTLSDANEWIANKLTPEHNTDNKSEVDRIIKEHPDKENNIISYGRLFQELQPLRALGDFRYKWSKECKMNFQVHLGEKLCISTADKSPFHYYTPPYLTATPEVNHRRLTPRDKFLVIASDGLWEKVSPLEVVRLVGEHMSGKVTFSRLKLKRNMCLNEINEILLKRKEALKTKPKDSNAATHLIRNAVGGGTEYGIDHRILSKSLSETDTFARYYRDDITVTVVFFDSEYWRDCSS